MEHGSLDYKINKYTYKLKHSKNRNEAETYQQKLQEYHKLRRGMNGGMRGGEDPLDAFKKQYTDLEGNIQKKIDDISKITGLDTKAVEAQLLAISKRFDEINIRLSTDEKAIVFAKQEVPKLKALVERIKAGDSTPANLPIVKEIEGKLSALLAKLSILEKSKADGPSLFSEVMAKEGPSAGPAKAPEGPAKAPEGPAKAPEGPAKAPEGPAKAPAGPAKVPEGPPKAPEGPPKAPAGPAKVPEGPVKGDDDDKKKKEEEEKKKKEAEEKKKKEEEEKKKKGPIEESIVETLPPIGPTGKPAPPAGPTGTPAPQVPVAIQVPPVKKDEPVVTESDDSFIKKVLGEQGKIPALGEKANPLYIKHKDNRTMQGDQQEIKDYEGQIVKFIENIKQGVKEKRDNKKLIDSIKNVNLGGVDLKVSPVCRVKCVTLVDEVSGANKDVADALREKFGLNIGTPEEKSGAKTEAKAEAKPEAKPEAAAK